MSSPDFPDWRQPVASTYQQVLLFSGNLGAGAQLPPIDVSQYGSVIFFANTSWFTADFTLDSAGTHLVQAQVLTGDGSPQLVTAPWFTLTNSGGVGATVFIYGTNRALSSSSTFGGTAEGYRAHTGVTAMAASGSYTLLAEFGTIPFGLCSYWWQNSSSTVLGIVSAVTVSGKTLELSDTNQLPAAGTGIGRSGTGLVVIPPTILQLSFLCTVAGTADVRMALSSVNL